MPFLNLSFQNTNTTIMDFSVFEKPTADCAIIFPSVYWNYSFIESVLDSGPCNSYIPVHKK